MCRVDRRILFIELELDCRGGGDMTVLLLQSGIGSLLFWIYQPSIILVITRMKIHAEQL
jgi:hypothetical protein